VAKDPPINVIYYLHEPDLIWVEKAISIGSVTWLKNQSIIKHNERVKG
jgi:hypothetical protein